MELPVISQAGKNQPEALVRAAKRADVILARAAAQETSLSGATVFTNHERPGVPMANAAFDLRIMDGQHADTVLKELADHYGKAGIKCSRLVCADTDWRPGLLEALEQHGYRRSTRQVLALGGYAPPEKASATIDPTAEERPLQLIPGRAAYPKLRLLFGVKARVEHHADDQSAPAFVQTFLDHLDDPRLDLFLALAAGAPIGVAGVLTLGQIGVMYPPFTHPDARGTGVATSLMAHTLDHCQRALLQQIILDAPDPCPATGLYNKLGFQAAASYTDYHPYSPR